MRAIAVAACSTLGLRVVRSGQSLPPGPLNLKD